MENIRQCKCGIAEEDCEYHCPQDVDTGDPDEEPGTNPFIRVMKKIDSNGQWATVGSVSCDDAKELLDAIDEVWGTMP